MALVKVIGLDHVVLRCADIEKSLAFYCDTLGLEPERVEEWRRRRGAVPVGAHDADDDHRPVRPSGPGRDERRSLLSR